MVNFENLPEIAKQKAEKRKADAELRASTQTEEVPGFEARRQAREHALNTVFEMFWDQGLLPRREDRKKSLRIYSHTIPLGKMSDDLPADMKHGFARVYLEYSGDNKNVKPADIDTDDKFLKQGLKEYGVALYAGPETPVGAENLTHLEDRYDRLINIFKSPEAVPLDLTPSILNLDSLLTELQIASTEAPAALTAAGPGEIAGPVAGPGI